MTQPRPLPVLLFLLALCLALCLAPSRSHAFPVTVDGRTDEWSSRQANGDNLGLIARDQFDRGLYSWRDPAADTRIDIASTETIADFYRCAITADPIGVSFLFQITGGNATTAPNPVQVQVAIDLDRVAGSGQTAMAGFADTNVAPSGAWEYLVQTQLTAGQQGVVYDRSFGVQGAPIPVGAFGISASLVEFTVPWSRLGLSGPPPTALRFTVATFREQPGGFTVDVGGPTVSNALDVLSDYGAPRTEGPHPNTSAEFTAPGDQTIDYNFDVWFGPTGEPYAPVLIVRFVTQSERSRWVALRNMTPAPLPLDGFRFTESPTAPEALYGSAVLPPAAVLGVGGVFMLAENRTTYAARYGEAPDGQWRNASEPAPDLATYPTWASGYFRLGFSGALLVIDRSHTVVDATSYGDPEGGYAGQGLSPTPGYERAASRSLSTFRDTDGRMSGEFTVVGPLCANDAECGGCGTCVLNVCEPFAVGTLCRDSAGPCDLAERCDGTSSACPADRFQPATVVCRAVSDSGCDLVETCTGSSVTCPADAFVAEGTLCADGLRCNGDERCDGAGTCRVGAPVVCAPAGAVCQENRCSEATGSCALTSVAVGTPCSDGDACNGDEACNASGVCVTVTPLDGGTLCRDASADVADVADVIDAADVVSMDVPGVDAMATDVMVVADGGGIDVTAVDVVDVMTTARDVAPSTTDDASPGPMITTPGGCGCRVGERAPSPDRGAVVLLVSLGAVVTERRRRRRPRALRS